MRKHFQEVHELMAKELLEAIYEKDKNANNFLLYYNGNIILRNNKKYKIPSLETEDGRQWNNASLIGICNLWMHTKRKKEQYENKLIETNMKLANLEKELEHIRPEIQKQENIIEKAKAKLQVAEKKYKEDKSKLSYLENTNLNSNEYFKVLEEFKVSERNFSDFKLKTKDATKNLSAIKDANSSVYTELDFYTAQKQELLHGIKAQNLNISSKSSQIDPILHSVAQVLMQRTKVMD